MKAVLPALVRGLGYGDLDIASGDTASAALETLLLEREELTDRERRKLRSQLLACCDRDTLGMAKLLEPLREVA